MKIKYFSGIFLIVFIVLAFALALFIVPSALKNTENATLTKIMDGTWSPTFEKALGEAMPISVPSRNFWGNLEYDLFGQGRKGVLVGRDGWLFTDEEFSCQPHSTKQMKDNLDYIQKSRDILSAQNVQLIIVFIPAKARVYADYIGDNIMPDCRSMIYEDTQNRLEQSNIDVVSLLPIMMEAENKDALFLKTDTHWTPQGAHLASIAIAERLEKFNLPKKSFKTVESQGQNHEGDLLRYLPGVGEEKIKHDILQSYNTDVNSDQGDNAAADLFGDDVPPVTLVGTSYSANPLWNFVGFIKDAAQVDILNMADEGLGPFTVMEKYLASNAFKDTPPTVLVWEIPERYLTMKPEFPPETKP